MGYIWRSARGNRLAQVDRTSRLIIAHIQELGHALTRTHCPGSDGADRRHTSDDAAKKDLEKFQGNRSLISADRDGKKTPEEEAKKIKLTIQGNQFILRKDGVVVSEGTMTLDSTKKPKEVTETITAGPNKGKVFSAIYDIDDEQHRVCFAAAGRGRPTAFSSSNGQLLQVWRRDKK